MPLQSPTPPRPRFRNSVQVRHHKARGCWTICIGKTKSADGKRLRPKDWYFRGTEAEANKQAQKLNERWNFLVKNWPNLYEQYLQASGEPFFNRPHWQPALNEVKLTDAEIKEYHRQPADPDEIAENYTQSSLKAIFALYVIDLKVEVGNADKGDSTAWTEKKNIRCALKFFPENLTIDALTSIHIQQARTAMLATLSRRTTKNYLTALHAMLRWFYDSAYGSMCSRPSNFEKSFIVKNATAKVRIPTMAEVKILLDAADDWQRLAIMLAINAGMYAVDIGRLLQNEINVKEKYVFWDREKQPRNPFRIRHDLWPETLKLVKKFMATKSDLAFTDARGLPLYRTRPSGKAFNKLDKPWAKLNAAIKKKGHPRIQFHNLRKATNQVLKDMLNKKINGDDQGQLIAIEEISATFLGHKSDELVRLYETRGVNGFGRLNKYLGEVRLELKSGGVFDCFKKTTKPASK